VDFRKGEIKHGGVWCILLIYGETASILHQPSDTQRVMKAVLLQRDRVSAGRTTRTTDLHRESLTTHTTENCSKHTSHEDQINIDWRLREGGCLHSRMLFIFQRKQSLFLYQNNKIYEHRGMALLLGSLHAHLYICIPMQLDACVHF